MWRPSRTYEDGTCDLRGAAPPFPNSAPTPGREHHPRAKGASRE